jgi:4-aminobutyrate aminotransferase-like enzyme/Ser/Thr protein kinase RdoA (MazF antagonist)
MLLEHTPKISIEAATKLAEDLYGIRATATPLPSERDQNFLLTTDKGEKVVLKIANALEERGLLEAQHAALAHIARHLSFCPRVVPTVSGETITNAETSSGTNLVRIVTFLPGTPLATVDQQSPDLLQDLGRRIAQVDRALANFDHPALHRDFHWDLANGLRVIREHSTLINDNDLRRLIDSFVIRFERDTLPLLPGLRKSAIHNDANDYNVLVSEVGDGSDRAVVGLVDFGDMVHSFTVGDLAIAIAYAILDKPDPLAAAAHVATGYHKEYPLNEDEVAALFGLVSLRLFMSVCHAAHQQRQRPDDAYLSISQKSIRTILPKLMAIDPRVAEHTLRAACGFSGRLTKSTDAETLAERRKWIGGNVSLAYRKPLKIVRGSMQYLYDDDEREYLDAYNNVPHVGHCHPRVVKAGQDQMALLNTNTRYLHDLINLYAERLTETLPEPLRVCFFVNSGSEANELALRLARAHTGELNLIVLEHAYHGNTTTLIDISPYKHNGPGGQGAPSWVHTAPIPDRYRGKYKSDDAQAGAKYAKDLEEIIERLHESKQGLSAFIAESLPSVAGQITFPPGYLSAVYDLVRQAGGVCIADEVQTGYGRIGTHFWGFESYGVVPDIVVLGKPIGNGHPIGVVITTEAIAKSFDNGMEFFSTFGGNTVSCAIGLEVLNVVLDEQLQEHAQDVGEHLLSGLGQLMNRHSIIGDVRGSGLFLGVELVRDRETLEPATDEATLIVNHMRDAGILLGTDGPHHNVIKIRPPMPFSVANANLLCATLDRILAKHYAPHES